MRRPKRNSYRIFLVLTLFLFTRCAVENSHQIKQEISSIEKGLLPAVQIIGDTIRNFELEDRMKYYKVPGVSIAIVKEGKIRWAKGYGIANSGTDQKIDENTLFQAGSISKPIAALAALKLWEEGKVDLDIDVNEYLVHWKVPENEFTKTEKVTLRRLLSHTAGFNVHGFPGYKQKDNFPSLEQVLNGDGNTDPVLVDIVPGSEWRYSGGGYTVMEKVIEDMSNMPLEIFMDEYILKPLEMKNSTYAQLLPHVLAGKASAAFDHNGKMIPGLWHNYPEQAAAGLWSTPIDLAKYCIEMQDILRGEKGILSRNTIQLMLTKNKNNWGLGPSLRWNADSLIFQHGGKNAGFTNNMIAFAHRGDAVIVMTNGDNGGDLINEILRSVSNYYNWNISNSRKISIIKLSPDKLEQYKGIYQFSDNSNFVFKIINQDNGLMLLSSDGSLRLKLQPVEEMKFIDMNKGDEIRFLEDEAGKLKGFVWNERFRFILTSSK